MKRTPLRRKSKSDIRKLEDAIWKECKRIVDKKHGTDCYTCPAKKLKGSNKQLGHMIPKAVLGAYLKYDIRLLRNQCAQCNIWRGGMGAEFYRRMTVEIGPTAMNEIQEDRKVTVKASDFYPQLLAKYQAL